MKKISVLLMALLGATVLVACNSGGGSSPSNNGGGDNNLSSTIKYVLGATSGYIAYSANGATWTTERITSQSNEDITSVIYGGGIWMAGSSVGNVYVSTDGKTWSGSIRADTSKGSINSIVYAQDKFVAVTSKGYALISTDGLNWTQTKFDSYNYSFRSVTYGQGLFVAVSSLHDICNSVDGNSWSCGSVGIPKGLLPPSQYGVAYGNGVFNTVGENHTTVPTNFDVSDSYYSTDGATWISSSSVSQSTKYGVAYGNGVFVAADGYISYVSTDGQTWTAYNLPTKGTISPNNPVTFDGSKFWVVGSLGLATSADNGKTWSYSSNPMKGGTPLNLGARPN